MFISLGRVGGCLLLKNKNSFCVFIVWLVIFFLSENGVICWCLCDFCSFY